MYQSYEDLDVWQGAVDLSVKIYQLFQDNRDYGFKDQICRASVSVPSNIAEGLERESKKETIHFLHIAKGSCAEMRTQLLISFKVDCITDDDFNALKSDAEAISRMLHGLIKSLRDKC